MQRQIFFSNPTGLLTHYIFSVRLRLKMTK